MAQLRIRLLGPFQVSLGEQSIKHFDSNKVRALLAFLAAENAQAHPRQNLADLLWPEMPPSRANSNLNQALYNLRQGIRDHQADPPYLLRTRESIQFNTRSDFWLDLTDFKNRLEGGAIPDHSKDGLKDDVLEELQAAVDLYRGDFLDGLSFASSPAFDEWVLIVRQRLQRQMIEALYRLAKSYANQGEVAQALSYARQQVELDPLSEPSYRQLMRLLAASGQRSQALAQFKRLQLLLAEELSVAPEPETLALRDQIRGQDQAPTSRTQQRDNLPAFLTPLVGRRQELAELQECLSNPNCRLLTVLGPGGSGKTRLALELARYNRKNFIHGVYFVSLNPLQSPDSITPTISEALNLPRPEGEDQQTLLTNYFREKQLLLVLDGFEHLLAGAGQVADILHEAPGLTVLVTSRMRLNIKGEHLYPLAGMRYPGEGASADEILSSDAVQLLVIALRRTRPDYQPKPDDIGHLHQVCEQVLGMPLGILLAASWGGVLEMAEIAGMVSQGLDYLAADWADVPARQRSLRATFDHTWKLLDERQQEVFKSLSVFRGAFTRQAAQAVCNASPYELRDLVDRSLLWHKSPGWIEVHELLRQYGREQLAGLNQVERDVSVRHSQYYLGQLARQGEELKGAGQTAALTSIDLEHENYRAAWDWAAEHGEITLLVPALEPLCLYYDLSLRYLDGENACRTALEGLPVDPVNSEMRILWASILTWQNRFMRLLGQLDEARPLLDQAQVQLKNIEVFGKDAYFTQAFLELESGNNHFHNDRTSATTCYQHSLQIFRQQQDDWGTAKALARLGLIAHHAGRFSDAVQYFYECLEIYRALEDPRGIANTLIELGHNSFRQGQINDGQNYIQEGIEILQQIGDRTGVARGYFELGRSYFWLGQFQQSCELMYKSIPIFEDLGMHDRLVFTVIALSLGFSHLGRYQDAISQVNKGLPLAIELKARREVGMAYLLLGKACLGLGDFDQALKYLKKSVAHYQEIDQKDELSWALAMTSFAERGLKHTRIDFEKIKQILQIGIDIQGYYPVLCAICRIALTFLDNFEIDRAVELAELAWRQPVVAHSRWFEDVVGREITTAAESLPPDELAAAQERGRVRDIWKTAAELLEELPCHQHV